MAPVILRMDVHCYGCAGKIRRVVKNLLGVEEVWVSVDTGLVVVAGTALDASLLRWRIQTRTRRPVTVVSDGADPEPPQPQYQYAAPPPGYPQHYHYRGTMQYMGPPPSAPPPDAAYPYYYGGGGGWVPAPAPQHLLQYVPTTTWDGYFPSRQYVPNQAPICFNDDNPNGCCAVQ
ncbi:unnamed protein product [Miscanthus lutarioriparius]|uniref:HMA domain-containing protein n=1 Tax=Miscanthus lutarioriparius TaxID=422564 RepID=A0A811MI61_9POAL|nr:unnamed protein product [Miscanthus lutarioriparius]